MIRTLSLFKYLLLITGIAVFAPQGARAQKPQSTPIPFSKPQADAVSASGDMRSVNKSDLSSLKKLNEKYRKAQSIAMDVIKDVKLGLIGSERKSTGKMQLAKGQLRLELEGAEHTLLVVNKKNVFAVTYPDKALKGAAVQIIKGDVSKKQKKPNALTSLLGPDGFLKSFTPIGVQTIGAEHVYFLAPSGDSDMTRAQLKVSNNEIRELHYWDARDNETKFSFSNVVFGAKVDETRFNYVPPADADVMNL